MSVFNRRCFLVSSCIKSVQTVRKDHCREMFFLLIHESDCASNRYAYNIFNMGIDLIANRLCQLV